MLIDPYRFATIADPFAPQTLLLVHAQEATSPVSLIEDVGIATFSEIGGGVLSATQAKFGTHSWRNPGTIVESTNYVRYAATTSPEYFKFEGEFTWEGWFYIQTKLGTFMNFFSDSINFPNSGFFQLALAISGNRLIFNSSAAGAAFFETAATGTTPTATWFHLACTRDALNVVRIFRDGVLLGSASRAGTIGNGTFDIGRGIASDNADFDGYWEEIRVTRACRYTANFTPPTAPFTL